MLLISKITLIAINIINRPPISWRRRTTTTTRWLVEVPAWTTIPLRRNRRWRLVTMAASEMTLPWGDWYRDMRARNKDVGLAGPAKTWRFQGLTTRDSTAVVIIGRGVAKGPTSGRKLPRVEDRAAVRWLSPFRHLSGGLRRFRSTKSRSTSWSSMSIGRVVTVDV